MSAKEFSQISRNIFYPIYPVIADQILKKGVRQGCCLDVGSGPGYLGLAIARQTQMQVCLFDINEEALEIAKQNIRAAALEERVYVEQGNVEALPYPDNAFNLVTSRGSLFFWTDQVKGINEIFRVLKPGGMAYLGNGFGNRELKKAIDEKMLSIDDKWLIKAAKRLNTKENYQAVMNQTKVNEFKIKADESGLWISFHKK
ncbi:class I SAM-dependent methyltransferase [Acetobacterium woodii]|uniref:Methyltransferase type 11 n=1 Tax=Acetobacterium woodii (strain ATCC 29683 / DSM 1030 / JCM 2381 / KCTC 1655 / WB1) TaxID=931626 RepID=H6LF04_ACEWD|nr:class I SAM-dependent methyltransferase [Acetobacterium woodii]AFA46910.1 methyltransferase type 11 [Acetobacterium woodii DSM 1030]